VRLFKAALLPLTACFEEGQGGFVTSWVFESAQNSDFIIPEGCYYLADTGYANSDSLLVPYHGVQYHLKEWASGGNKWDLFIDINCSMSNILQAPKPSGTLQL
jgi:hypothetical protein